MRVRIAATAVLGWWSLEPIGWLIVLLLLKLPTSHVGIIEKLLLLVPVSVIDTESTLVAYLIGMSHWTHTKDQDRRQDQFTHSSFSEVLNSPALNW
jgi:hypothetical protein